MGRQLWHSPLHTMLTARAALSTAATRHTRRVLMPTRSPPSPPLLPSSSLQVGGGPAGCLCALQHPRGSRARSSSSMDALEAGANEEQNLLCAVDPSLGMSQQQVQAHGQLVDALHSREEILGAASG